MVDHDVNSSSNNSNSNYKSEKIKMLPWPYITAATRTCLVDSFKRYCHHCFGSRWFHKLIYEDIISYHFRCCSKLQLYDTAQLICSLLLLICLGLILSIFRRRSTISFKQPRTTTFFLLNVKHW